MRPPDWTDGHMVEVWIGDVRERLADLPDQSVHAVVTSPPYWGLRDYGTGTWTGGDPTCRHVQRRRTSRDGIEALGERFRGGGHRAADEGATAIQYRERCRCGAVRADHQLGLEPTPAAYVEAMVSVFREVWRVLRDDGSLWLNMGDCYVSQPNGNGGLDKSTLSGGGERSRRRQHSPKRYPHPHDADDRTFRDKPFSTVVAGLKRKDLVGMPWRLALALQDDGWWLRADIIWSKPNPMPESVTDRPTKSHEYLFLLTKGERYFYDATAIIEPGTTTRPELLAFGERPDVGYTGHSADRRRYKEPNGRVRSPYGQGFTRRGDALIGDDRKATHHQRHRSGVSGAGGGQDLRADPVFTRNRRSVWTIATQPFPSAHFATFPEELPRLCILAGTSARGCCPSCGAPWERATERHATGYDGSKYGERAVASSGGALSGGTGHSTLGSSNGKLVGTRETTGWRPSCDDYDPLYRTFPQSRSLRQREQRRRSGDWWRRARRRPGQESWERVPAVVLDPFAGSGTTLAVAKALDRCAQGVELNPDYLRFIRERVGAAGAQLTLDAAL